MVVVLVSRLLSLVWLGSLFLVFVSVVWVSAGYLVCVWLGRRLSSRRSWAFVSTVVRWLVLLFLLLFLLFLLPLFGIASVPVLFSVAVVIGVGGRLTWGVTCCV